MKYSQFKSAQLGPLAAKYSQIALLGLALLIGLSLKGQMPLLSGDAIQPGMARPGHYLPLLYGKKIGVVANATSAWQGEHLVDFLLRKGLDVQVVFAPEHGFRGEASAGVAVANSRDEKTGLPIISLYGATKKPRPEDLAELDYLIFDIQDVGVRFYTYISTLTYVMEACAENDLPLIVLDRPNPHGYYVDGPVLQPGYESFVGLHPVPIVHGMTIGEYAQMVNGEGWLTQGARCPLTVVPCAGYTHRHEYRLPLPPSPNLPNDQAVTLYPSLALFEGTIVSVGRGTDIPFQVAGAPWFTDYNATFTPEDRNGALNPPYEGQLCRGFDLRNYADMYIKGLGKLYLFWLQDSYAMAPDKKAFFTNYFDKLAGNSSLRQQIIDGVSVDDIRASWEEDLAAFRQMRQPYLLYD